MKVQNKSQNTSLLRSGGMGLRFFATLLSLSFIVSWFSPLAFNLHATGIVPGPGDNRPTSVPGLDRADETAAHDDFDNALNILEETGDLSKVAPPKDKLTDDIEFLGKQKLKLYGPKEDSESKVIPMDGRPLVGLPGLMPADLVKDVQYAVDDNGDFVVRLYKEDRVGARLKKVRYLAAELVIEGLKAKSIAVDRDYIAVLDSQNRVYAFDHALVRKNFMQSILIPVRVASASNLDPNKEFKIQWNSPTSPFVALADGMDPNAYLQAGDLVIYEEINGQKKMATPPIDVATIEISVFERQSALATIVPNPGEQITPIMQLASEERVRIEAAKVQDALIKLDSSDVLYSFDPHAIADLVTTGAKTHGYLNDNRHKFTQFQWLATLKAKSDQENFPEKEKAFAESTEALAGTQKGLIRRTLTPGRLAAVAAITAGWFFTGVGHEDGIVSHFNDTVAATHVLQWKLYIYSKLSNILSLYDNVVMTDAAIRSGIVLSFVVPFTNTIGHLFSKFVTGFKNTGSAMAQCIIGMRLFAKTMQIFVHGIASFVGQPLIVEAMRHGINPFRYVRSDSYAAQEIARRKGVEKVPGLFAGAGYGRQEDRKAAIGVMAEQREKLLATATTIAFKLAADAEGVDPSLLLSLADKDLHSLDQAKLKQLLADKDFNKRWFIVANKMVEELAGLKNPTELFELRDLDPAAVEKLFQTATQYAKKVKSFGFVRKELGMAHARWKNFWRTAMQKVGAWGFRSKEFLTKGLPSRTAVNLFYIQYTVDMQMMVWLIPLASSRASLEHPADLAGDPNKWHHSSNNHNADMGEQAAAYLVRGAAGDALEFRESEQNDRAWEYNPNYVLAEGEERQETFLKSLFGFSQQALNLRDRSYGFRFWSNFKIRLETFNAFLFWNLISRYVIGSTNMMIHDAIAATSWSFLWRQFYYGWIWDALNRGKEAHMHDLSAFKTKMRKARAQLLQELRVTNNESSLLAAAKTLCSIYGEGLKGGKMDAHGQKLMDYFANNNESELLRAYGESKPAGILQVEAAIGKLHEDLIINPDSIGEEERSRIRKRKIQEIDLAVDQAAAELESSLETKADELRLNALHLLKYSQRHIPKATHLNGAADTIWTYSGAISTTIIGTVLFAATQHTGVPWPTKLLEAAAVVSGLYFVTYNAQRIFNVTWDYFFRKPKKDSAGCKAALGGG